MTQVDTSLQAYMKKKDEGSLEGDRKNVYDIIKRTGPVGLKEIAERMGKYPHQVSGRITELKDMDLVETAKVVDGEQRYEVKK